MVASSAPTPADTAPRGVIAGAAAVAGQYVDASASADQAGGSFPALCPSVPPSLCPVLLDALASPHHSLASVAEKHGLTLSALLTWLELPETRAELAARESAAYAHVRYVSALNLSHAAHTASRIVESFNATPRPADPFDPNYFRVAVHARMAASLLLRFSRLYAAAAPTPARPASGVSDGPTGRATAGRPASGPTSARPPITPPRAPSSVSDPRPAPTGPTEPPSPTALSGPTAPPGPTKLQDPADPTDPTDMDAMVAHLKVMAKALGIDLPELEMLDALDDPTLSPAERAAVLRAAEALNTS
jgi:hypothetical protein